MRVIGYTIQSNTIVNSDMETCNKAPFLEFLLQQKEDSLKVFYHMGLSVANLFKMIHLTHSELEEINRTTELYIPPYRLKFVPGKFFSIYKGQVTGFFNDASQYKTFNSVDYELNVFEQVQEAKKVAEQVIESLTELELNPRTITSPIAAYEKGRMKDPDFNLPTVDDIPEEAGEYAFNCCKNNWVETYKLGHFEHAYHYDINSAYPSQLWILPELRSGEWIKSYGEALEKARLGYYKCKLNIIADFHPILMTILHGNNARNYTPYGERDEEFLTLKQLEFINRWEIGSFQIIDGWNWKHKIFELTVLSKEINRLYYLKSKIEKENKNIYGLKSVKRVMAGIYGKLLQQNPETGELGDWFNPVYAAEVECNTQLKVAEFCLENKILPISIAVDGIISDTYIDIGNDGTKERRIGQWRYSGDKKVLSIGSGTVAVEGEKQDGDFSLDYDWIVEQIKKNPEANQYTMTKMSPISLSVAINQKKLDKLGEMHEVTKSIDIQSENKRCYRKYPNNGGELLNNVYVSEPWDTGTLMNFNGTLASDESEGDDEI